MAGGGGLKLSIGQPRYAAAKAQLESIGRSIDPVMRGTLDTTAMELRKRRYTPAIAPMFKSRSWVNKRIIVKRVNLRRGRIDARLIPSSAGVYVTEYRRWGFQTISPTRARILVGSFKGHKVAAGFVNPASFARQPWRTRSERARSLKRPPKLDQRKSYRYATALEPALGPSIAWFFKQLTNNTTMRYAERLLQQEFQRRLRKELLKGSR
jgi:hypothetical protein